MVGCALSLFFWAVFSFGLGVYLRTLLFMSIHLSVCKLFTWAYGTHFPLVSTTDSVAEYLPYRRGRINQTDY